MDCSSKLSVGLQRHVEVAREEFIGMFSCASCALYVVWVLAESPWGIMCTDFEAIPPSKDDLIDARLGLHRGVDGKFLYRDNANGHASEQRKPQDMHIVVNPSPHEALDLILATVSRRGYAKVDMCDGSDNCYSKHNHVFVLWKNPGTEELYMIHAYAYQFACRVDLFDRELFLRYISDKSTTNWNALFGVHTGADEVTTLTMTVSS
jgi:hypothetical protein